MNIDPYSRTQTSLNMYDMFPSLSGVCACGCGIKLTGRKTRWASRDCNTIAYQSYSIIKGNGSFIRSGLFQIEAGFCRKCGVYDENWEADHVIPVSQGGGGCDLTNFQTLCQDCHKDKTRKMYLDEGR